MLWNSDSAQMGSLLSELSNLMSEWTAVGSKNEQIDGNRLISGELMIEIEHILSQIRTFE